MLVTISVATLKVFDLVQTFGADSYNGSTLANQMYTYLQAPASPSGGGSAARRTRSSALAMVIFLLVIPFVGLPGAADGEGEAGR